MGIAGRERHYRQRGASRADRALQVEMVIAGKDGHLHPERGLLTGRDITSREGH